jgi:UDP-N-acetylglucosamine--N-acetylmuramyl-(pentapeptide) pyrophosphoryl-undecaprenol N-acetylglucosamine transferase
MPKIIIAAAGTGGHVFPGLAVADSLNQQGVSVVWLGTKQGKERDWVDKALVSFQGVDMQGLRGNGILGWLKLPFRLLRAIAQAWRVLKHEKPDLLLVMGGYISVPAGIAARLLGIPVWLHEQNAIAGLSNRLLAPLSERVFLGLPLQYVPFGWEKAELIGNPLRKALERSNQARHDEHALRVLVVGGSQGASFLNTLLPQVVADALIGSKISIWHQTGEQARRVVNAAYLYAGASAKVDAFIEDMASAYAWADIVIARSGALTVAEVAQTARSALFIPFPFAVDNHQYYNALSLVEVGAAQVLIQSQATVENVRDFLNHYLIYPEKHQLVYNNLSCLPENTAAAQLANAIISKLTIKK